PPNMVSIKCSGIFFFSSRRRHTRFSRDGVQTCALPISVAMHVAVIGHEPLVRRQARAKGEVGLDACARRVDAERREQRRDALRMILDRRAQGLEALTGRGAPSRALERASELRPPPVELAERGLEPRAPFAERGRRLGEQPRDRSDVREVDLAARAAIAVRGLVERRAVAARAREERGQLRCRHAGESVAESGDTLGYSRFVCKRNARRRAGKGGLMPNSSPAAAAKRYAIVPSTIFSNAMSRSRLAAPPSELPKISAKRFCSLMSSTQLSTSISKIKLTLFAPLERYRTTAQHGGTE